MIDLVSVFEGVGAYRAGTIDGARLKVLEDHGCPTCGSCSGLFTANSMNCLMEALGLALPWNGSALAGSPERDALYRGAASHLLELIERDLTPRQIVTEEAIDDAFALDMAMGGSTNTVLHTLAIAREAGIDYSLERIKRGGSAGPTSVQGQPSWPLAHGGHPPRRRRAGHPCRARQGRQHVASRSADGHRWHPRRKPRRCRGHGP